MRKVPGNLIYLLSLMLIILTACGPKDKIEIPVLESSSTPEAGATEESADIVETNLDGLLNAGSAMKWYDGGFLVFVPGGEVILGDTEYENNPEHKVYLDNFWIYTFKVTNGQYRRCVATGTCSTPASEPPYPVIEDPEIKDHPVIGVTWEQANTYCKWMNGRLPTEAEWEKVARGPQSDTFPWGEDEPECNLLNFGKCENGALSRVFEYPGGKSFYEAYDLAGNAFEWVSDWYQEDYPATAPESNPTGPPNGEERSVRGSSFKSGEDLIPSAQRFYLEPEEYRVDLGFRCVVADPQPFANACVQTIYNSSPAPWQPGSPNKNKLPDFEDPTCVPDYNANLSYYCANQSLQQGGLDITFSFALGNNAYVKSWSSNDGAFCIVDDYKTGCFGPEGGSVTLEICGSCTPDTKMEVIHQYCDSGYTMTETVNPICEYTGSSPVPGETCPASFIYDPIDDICVKVGANSVDCPAGYIYDAESECCTATYATPSDGSDDSPDPYLVCPPGYGNVVEIAASSPDWMVYAQCAYVVSPTTDTELCKEIVADLGYCDDPAQSGCKNPGSYLDQTSCEAAKCKWAVGPTSSCVFP